MDTQKTAKELSDLAAALQKFVADLVADRRGGRGNLEPQELTDLERFETQILILASKLNTEAVGLRLQAIASHLAVLERCAQDMKRAAEKIDSLRLGIAQVTTFIALIGTVTAAIASGNVLTMIEAAASVAAVIE